MRELPRVPIVESVNTLGAELTEEEEEQVRWNEEQDFRERMAEEPDLPHEMQDEDSDDWDSSFGVQNKGRAWNPGWMWDIRISTPTASNEHEWTEYRVIAVNLTIALENLTYAIDYPVAREVISVRRGQWWNPVRDVAKIPKFSELSKKGW